MKKSTVLTAAVLAATAALGTTQAKADDVQPITQPANPTAETQAQSQVTAKQVADAKAEKEAAEKQNATNQAEASKAEQAKQVADTNVANTQKQVTEAEKAAAEATPEKIAETEAGKKAAEDALKTAKTEQVQKQADLDATRAATKPATEAVQNQEKEVSKAQDNVKAVQTEKANVDVTAAQAEANAQAKAAAEKSADKEVSQAKDKVSQAEAAKTEAEKAQANQAAAIAKAEKDAATKKDSVSKAEADLKAKSDKLADLQEKAREAAKKAAELKARAADSDVKTENLMPPTLDWFKSIGGGGHKRFEWDKDGSIFDKWIDEQYDRGGFKATEADKKHKIDVRNLTEDEYNDLVAYTLETINWYNRQIEKLIANDPSFTKKYMPKLIATKKSLQLGRDYAKAIMKAFPKGIEDHESGYLSQAAEKRYGTDDNVGAEALSPTANGYGWTSTMAKMKESILKSIRNMLFNDWHANNNHASSITYASQLSNDKNKKSTKIVSFLPTADGKGFALSIVSYFDEPQEETLRPDCKAQAEEAARDAATLETQAALAQTAVTQAESEVARAKVELSAAENKLASLKSGDSGLAKAIKDVETAKTNLATAEAKALQAHDEKVQANQALAAAKTAQTNAAAKVNVANHVLETEQAKLAKVKADAQAALTQLATAEKAAKDADKKVANLEMTVKHAEQQLSAYKSAQAILANLKAQLADALKVQKEAQATYAAAKEKADKYYNDVTRPAIKKYNQLQAQFDAEEAIRKAEEAAKKAEEQRKAEDERKANEAKKAEERRQAEEAKKAEEHTKNVEEQRNAEAKKAEQKKQNQAHLSRHFNASQGDSTSVQSMKNGVQSTSTYSRMERIHGLPKTGQKSSSMALVLGGFLAIAGLRMMKRKEEK